MATSVKLSQWAKLDTLEVPQRHVVQGRHYRCATSCTDVVLRLVKSSCGLSWNRTKNWTGSYWWWVC